MSDRPFSLRPRSSPRGPQSIAEFIERSNARPGEFRDLDSAELQRQIDARQNGHGAADSDHDVDMTGDGDGDGDGDANASEADSDANEPKDVAAVREDFL